MDWDHANRALMYRQLNNPTDITLMLLFTLLVLLLLFAGLIYLNRSKKSRYFVTPAAFLILVTLIKVIQGFLDFSMDGLALALPEMSMLKLFYLCDGVIILLAYSFQVSYEAMNLILFFLVQPLIIAGLFIISIRQQLKLHRYEQSTHTT